MDEAPAEAFDIKTNLGAAPGARKHLSSWIRFDRNELSGAFGDIGTDFPLVIGLILAARLDPASVLTMFGLAQIFTGLLYGLPMPVQPLKAVAVIVITQKLNSTILYGGGLAIGLTMLVLAATGLLGWLAKVVPKSVIRGIQFGLGLQLAALALKEYVPAGGSVGYVIAGVAFAVTVTLLGNRRYPPAPFLIAFGVLYALALGLDPASLEGSVGLRLPSVHVPVPHDVLVGFVLLALPQVPLSLGNSILATRQIVDDLFPARSVSVRKVAFTYAAMNLMMPFFSGVPVCHGSGGMAGHYAFGARTGGAVVLYGALYLILGLFLSAGFTDVIRLFPTPILGIILLFEAVTLMRLTHDVASSKADFSVMLMVSLAAVSLPYGYLVGLVGGTCLAHLSKKQLIGLAR